ncbi:calcium channel subunit Mid1 [Lentithecium fluviatile CBS 122367]|uniref:Calcium channel subunit Mid1 n=1 Tax=Lentithecium fluviatile CBS 122367 TaxID=1168545 RepID=A0A6G1JEF6_9PLEO|nr:calcium channel subunit Mid1 [Lentithecium fluviatile CBS 122367]
MQLPKLTPLQSRLLASAVATGLVIVLWICIEPRNLVYAAEVPIPEHAQSNEFVESIPPSLLNVPPIDLGEYTKEERSNGVYAPDFIYFDRSVVGRQAEEVEQLSNNKKAEVQASPGSTKYFRFKPGQTSGNSARTAPVDASEPENMSENNTDEEGAEEDGLEDELEKRQSGTRMWISANACRGPKPTITLITDDTPQLTLYVSTSSKVQKPGPDTPETTPIPFYSGFANFTLQTDSEVYMGISAPNLTTGWNGSWSYELVASTVGQYHNYANNSNFIFMVDTDSESALFITHNFTSSNSSEEVEKWKRNNPFTMFAFPVGNWSDMIGLEASYCALEQQFPTNNLKVNTSITTIFGGAVPVSQFHITGLEADKDYQGFLAVNGSDDQTMNLTDVGLVRAGGEVFKQFTWKTKADDSCQVIFNLDFCNSVAYAVPSSPEFKLDDDRLKKLYDDQAKAYYRNFSNALDQVACDTASTAQYSLARNCNDCRRDYKAWLCSVLIPRCKDWNANETFLQERNINARLEDGTVPHADNLTKEFNQTFRERFAYSRSRNPMVDQVIKPGPYKELLPCEDLCFDLVRSCPAQLGFACPNSPARELSYGRRNTTSLTCNFPGAVVDLSPLKSGVGFLALRAGTLVLMSLSAMVWVWI